MKPVRFSVRQEDITIPVKLSNTDKSSDSLVERVVGGTNTDATEEDDMGRLYQLNCGLADGDE